MRDYIGNEIIINLKGHECQATIKDWRESGFIIQIDSTPRSIHLTQGDVLYISHSTPLMFQFI